MRGPGGGARTAGEATVIKSELGVSVGRKAPDFSLAGWPGGARVGLKNFRGRVTVLYFYPKDGTPGCTREACEFGAAYATLRAAGAELVGVSPDPVGSHAAFAAKHGLAFTLLSDPDHKVAEAYGVWVRKNLYGRVSMGVRRATFLLDARGVVRRVWTKVKPEGHAAEVLAALKDL